MQCKIELMRKVLDGLLEEVEEISEQIKTKGIVPEEICKLCRVRGKRNVVEFSLEERKILGQFNEWLREMNIIAIEKYEDAMGQWVALKTSERIGKGKARHEDEDGYVYILPHIKDTRSNISKTFSKYPQIRGFLSKFEKIGTCPHISKHPNNVLKIGSYDRLSEGQVSLGMPYIPRKLKKERIVNKLYLCCDDCKQRIENTMCNGVRKHGFLFDYDCPLEDIILRKRLSQNGLVYEDLEEREKEASEPLESHAVYSHSYHYVYYVRQESIVILHSQWRTRSFEKLQNIVKYLKPELIVVFDEHANLPSYLEFKTNILFYNEDGLFFYDKNRESEENVQRICDEIVNVLNRYIEKERGKEHDRIVSALSSIGEELGFVPQLEYNKGSGVRIDCVWFDRDGNIQVALEVETSSTWKKDLISTWEVEPKLAVIVGHAKSDKVATNLMKTSLMKSVPHLVLYINKPTEHAFLFDKQEMIKHYTIKQEEEDKRKDISII